MTDPITTRDAVLNALADARPHLEDADEAAAAALSTPRPTSTPPVAGTVGTQSARQQRQPQTCATTKT